MTKEELERFLAEDLSLEQIGQRVGKAPSTVSYHLKKHGLAPVNKGLHANKGALDEDRLKELVGCGYSIREIAGMVERSPATVQYWLRRYEIRTRGMGLRRPEFEAGRRAGTTRVISVCSRHGEVEYVLEGRGSYRCLRCRSENVAEWRRRAKRRLVEAAGGACALCGYDRYLGGLQFHHVDPATKCFSISREGVTRSFAELEREAAKCVLLCGNCHAEVEEGIRQVSIVSAA